MDEKEFEQFKRTIAGNPEMQQALDLMVRVCISLGPRRTRFLLDKWVREHGASPAALTFRAFVERTIQEGLR